jgi:N-acetylneuraminic acid mutarotase
MGTQPPISSKGTIVYKDGKLYFWDVTDIQESVKIYVYDIETGYWSLIEHKVSYEHPIEYGVICVYNDTIYMIDTIGSIIKLKTEGNSLEWDKLVIDSNNLPIHAYSYIVNDRYLYIFAGYNDYKNLNGLWRIDLSSDNLQWINISRDMNTPTPRSGHAMEVYNEELYILGGVDKYGFK